MQPATEIDTKIIGIAHYPSANEHLDTHGVNPKSTVIIELVSDCGVPKMVLPGLTSDEHFIAILAAIVPPQVTVPCISMQLRQNVEKKFWLGKVRR